VEGSRPAGPDEPGPPAPGPNPEPGGERRAPGAAPDRAAGGTAARRPLRHLWTAAGLASFAVGAVGAFLPLLPTVPLMLLSAFCFARGSERCHRWLVHHPHFGSAIRDWQAHGAISPTGKRAAVVAIAATFGISVLLGLPGHALAIQAAVLACVLAFVLTRPDGPRD
jgi:uncharacterized membrane protein YbaN (DUF454 family)